MFGLLNNFKNPSAVPTQAPAGASCDLALCKSSEISVYQADSFVRTGALPKQLEPMTRGQSETFKRQSAEYYARLAKSGKVDAKTVTPAEFVKKAEPLARLEAAGSHWLHAAWDWLTAHNSLQAIVTQGAHERAEREQANEQINRAAQIENEQLESRKRALIEEGKRARQWTA